MQHFVQQHGLEFRRGQGGGKGGIEHDVAAIGGGSGDLRAPFQVGEQRQRGEKRVFGAQLQQGATERL